MFHDQRSEKTKQTVLEKAIASVMSARRAVVDVRLDRVVEDEILQLTSRILDILEDRGCTPTDTTDSE